jgi:hypothetical protein
VGLKPIGLLAVATGEIWRQVAEHVVGLKLIGLFEKEKY